MNRRQKWFITIVLIVWSVAIGLSIYLEDRADPTCLKGLGTRVPCEIYYTLHNR